MARYTIGGPTNGTATANAVRWELRAGARPCRLMELLIANEAATVATLLLHRASAIGLTPTTPLTPEEEDDDDNVAALAATAIAWATAPTVPGTPPLKRLGFPATIGAAWFLSFGERGLYIPVNGSLILINLAASSSALLGVTATIED